MDNEADTKTGRAILKSLDNRRLRLILLPTEKCNFRCTYCYETFELGQMSAWVIQGIKNLLAKRAEELRTLEIDWFGGEPLLGMSTIEEISLYILHLRQQYGFDFCSSMTTNAYLLKPKLLTRLVDLGVKKYQVTLDGYGEFHDRTRQRKNREGSFTNIWQNLLAARDLPLDYRIMLRIHFSPANLAELPLLIDRIKEEFGNDDRFHVFFKAVGHYGGANDANVASFGRKSAEKYQSLLLDRLGTKVKGSVLEREQLYVCYASEPNSLVIRPNGKIAKCTVAFEDERNDVGMIHEDGSLSFSTERLQLWFKGLHSKDKRDLACPHSQMGEVQVGNSQDVSFQPRIQSG